MAKGRSARTARSVAATAAAAPVAALVAAMVATGAPAQDAARNTEPLVVVATAGEPAAMDSASAYSANSGTVLRNIFEPLIHRDAATNEPVPALATAWEQVDPRTWRFHLREGVTFHDGSAFDAQAAADALSYVWSAENNFRLRTFIGPEMTFRPVARHILEIATEEPDPLLLSRLWQSVIPSARQIREEPERWYDLPVGTGPYRFVSWDRGNSVTLEQNADWWGHQAPDAMGRVAFATARFDFRPEAATRIAALEAGEVAFAERLPPEPCRANLGDACVQAPDNETTYLRLDAMNPVLGDVRVRRAMSLAIDRETIGEVLLGGADPAAMIVGPSATGFNPDLAPHPYDMERAAALIAEAKADGVPIDEMPLRLASMRNAFPGNQDVLEVVLESFDRIGLDNVETEILEREAFITLFINPPRPIDPERGLIMLHKHGNDAFDFQSTVSLFYMCGTNNSTSCNPEVDRRNLEAMSLTGPARQEAYAEIAAILYEDNNIIPLHHIHRYHGVDQDLVWTPRLDMMVMLTDMAPRQ